MKRNMSVDEAYEYWCSKPPISSLFPVRFENGREGTEYKGCCLKCDGIIPDDDLRGEMSRPTAHVAVVEGIGLCRDCKMLTPFFGRIRDDFSMDYIDQQGRWQRAFPEPERQKSLLVNMLKKVDRLLRGGR